MQLFKMSSYLNYVVFPEWFYRNPEIFSINDTMRRYYSVKHAISIIIKSGYFLLLSLEFKNQKIKQI